MINIEGKLIEKFETVQITETFKKREFVLEYIENPEYPEFIKIELIQDKCDLIDKINIGEQIKVYLNIKGRKWTNKEGKINYFNSLQAWKIEFENENYNQELDQKVNNSDEEENINEKLPF
jgi:hypothetical protein|tara:strand:- start:310 stop:672 length:363 start_codon:yes stop_codon:yes gene_type:complete